LEDIHIFFCRTTDDLWFAKNVLLLLNSICLIGKPHQIEYLLGLSNLWAYIKKCMANPDSNFHFELLKILHLIVERSTDGVEQLVKQDIIPLIVNCISPVILQGHVLMKTASLIKSLLRSKKANIMEVLLGLDIINILFRLMEQENYEEIIVDGIVCLHELFVVGAENRNTTHLVIASELDILKRSIEKITSDEICIASDEIYNKASELILHLKSLFQ
jgi:hypothetical protein